MRSPYDQGLDFPNVDWVVQADCPEDVPCYIHRVGRTARYTAEGRGLLLLTPSEANFAKELAAAKAGMSCRLFIHVYKAFTRLVFAFNNVLEYHRVTPRT